VKWADFFRREAVRSGSVASAQRDALVLGILISAVMLLVWNGSHFFRQISFATDRFDGGIQIASTALTLNVALILFGWRRYVDVQHESQMRAESEDRAALIATTDAMTGLLNRKGFADRATVLAGAARGDGERMVMISVQMHRFKSINDRHGYDVGDELLRRLAAAILAVVDREVAVARLSGDEFALGMVRSPGDRPAIEIGMVRFWTKRQYNFYIIPYLQRLSLHQKRLDIECRPSDNMVTGRSCANSPGP
jgi:GGDEF domain-containing protein